jgi:hypothetical protein
MKSHCSHTRAGKNERLPLRTAFLSV